MADDGASSSSAGIERIGREIAQHYADAGDEVVITCTDAAPCRRGGGARSAASTRGIGLDLTQPETIRDALADVGPVRYLVLAGDRPRRQQRARLRHRTRHPPRHAEARRLHRGRPRAARPPADEERDRAVRRPRQGPAVPGLDDGLDGERRHRRPGANAGRRAGADARQRHPPRHRGRQPVLGGQEPRPHRRSGRPPGGSTGWPTSWTRFGSCSRTRPSTGSTCASTAAG